MSSLPSYLVDAHHHFFDPANTTHASFLGGLGAPAYLPEQYAADTRGLSFAATVHVEAMADVKKGPAEVKWCESLKGRAGWAVGAYVGSVDLASPEADARLAALVASSPKVRGVRWIVDYVGPFDGKTATHVNTKRFGKDYLRDPEASVAFAKGFALLAKYNLSFDLQCAPAQLAAAYDLFVKHPDIPVVICHLGKPRHLQADGKSGDAQELAVWRAGMKKMASLPNVYVKLSMVGYAVPGWHQNATKEALLKSLVTECIGLFGAQRCMFASNYHINAACSDSDGACDSGPSPVELYQKFNEWVSEYSRADRALLFGGTARQVYRLDEHTSPTATGKDVLAGCTVTYFPITGRGDSVRLALTTAGVAFTDNRVAFKDWGALKPTTPWGSMPILTLQDGAQVTQQRAILRLIGKLTGQYPSDVLAAARVDEILDVIEDVATKLNATGRGMEQKAKEEARQACVSEGGIIYTLLAKLEAFVGTHGSPGYSVGTSRTVADFGVAQQLIMATSGFFDGVPSDCCAHFTNLQAILKSVSAHPAVAAYVKAQTHQMYRLYPVPA